jgi:hypothetical protein
VRRRCPDSTTTVDVDPPLRRALARVGGLDPLQLAAGADELVVPQWTVRWWRESYRAPAGSAAEKASTLARRGGRMQLGLWLDL